VSLLDLPSSQEAAALAVAKAVAEAIRELGSVPAGHLYAVLMARMSLETFEKIVGALVGAGLVRRDGSHLLTWTGRPA
jgi:hypothetical protein